MVSTINTTSTTTTTSQQQSPNHIYDHMIPRESTAVLFHLQEEVFGKLFAGCVADSRFATAGLQVWSALGQGGRWALLAATCIPGVSLKLEGLRYEWDQVWMGTNISIGAL